MPLLKREDLSTEQRAGVEAIISRRRLSLWAKPGSGKTAIAATAVSDMFEGPTLVLATKRIAELVWRQELERWEHLQHIKAVLLSGSPRTREKLLGYSADFYLLNYELAPWLAETLAGGPWPFRSIVFDEVSKLKWPGTKRFKRLRRPVLDIPVRIGLTGTPRGNAVLGLWGQSYMTAATHEETPLAPSMARFRTRWFHPVDKERRIWRPNSGAEEEVREAAAAHAYALPRNTASPEAKVVPVSISIPARIRALYAALDADLTVDIGGHTIEAPGTGQARGKLLQLCSGAIYTDPERKNWIRIHDAKLDALEEIIDELQGAPLLVLYRFRHELDRIRERWPDTLTIDDTDKWLRSGGILAVHPESAGHGLNLHVGGCSSCVWFTLPESQELWEQGNRRLARRGQREDVTAHVLAIQNTVEHNIARNLASHGRLQDVLIDAATPE